MPLNNRQDFETTKLHGVNLAADESKLQFGWFTHLANWIPAHRLKIKKKRGVDDVPTGDFFTPEPCPVVVVPCLDTAYRGQQTIVVEQAFDQATTFGGGNLRTSWGFIDQGEAYTMVGDADCGSGNMPYTADCVQINHYVDDVATLADGSEPPAPDPASAMVNTRVGSSDQSVWVANSNSFGGARIYYNLGATYVEYAIPTSNFGGANFSAFAIEGNQVWFAIGCCLDGGPPNTEVCVFDRATGVKIADYFPWGTDIIDVYNMNLTTDYLYVLGVDRVTSDITLFKIARVDGTLTDSINVTAIGANLIAVADDTLIYLLCSGVPGSVYYLENFTTLTYVGNVNQALTTVLGNSSAIWNNGTLYYGNNGFSGNNVDINKIVIACPPDVETPLLASITTDATVVAGADITVTWADVFEPDATDTILIKPAPSAGVYGLVGSTVASATNSSALSDGSTLITIPGGTAAGNYVAMYAALGTIWVATSDVFTVT